MAMKYSGSFLVNFFVNEYMFPLFNCCLTAVSSPKKGANPKIYMCCTDISN